MKTKILISAMVSVLVISPLTYADHKYKKGHDGDAFNDHAKVVNVEPIIRNVTVTVPQKECWDEQVSYPQRRTDGDNAAGKMILGGIIGGVIGSRFGGGHGRDIATVAGTLIGASVGHDRAQRQPVTVRESGVAIEQRCQISHQQHTEERLDGYQVSYRYKGEMFTTRMANDPGDRIRVRVKVVPIEKY